MESTTIDDRTGTGTGTLTENDNGSLKNGQINGVNGRANHVRKHSSTSSKDYEMSNKDSNKCAPEKRASIGAYEKLRGLFRSKGSSAGSKSPPRIKVSMYPDGTGDKSMAQSKGSSHFTKLTLESRETEEESDTDFEIPNDGNLYGFSPESMMQFFKYMHFEEKIVKSLQRRKVDGRKFAKMTDEDLKKYGIDNPIVVYFRSRSEKKRESKNLFML